MTKRGRRVRGALAALAAAAVMTSLSPTGRPAPAQATTRVIVQGDGAADLARAVEDAGGHVERRLPSVGAVTARVPSAGLARLTGQGFAVSPDPVVRVTSASFVPDGATVQTEAARPGPRWSTTAGEGVGVALVDTGVADVAGLAGRVVHGPDLSGEGDGVDRHGHGTFMAGLVAGDGVGLAPGAHVVSVKVAGRDGSTTLATVLAGIDWVIGNADEHDVRVLNLSVAVDMPMSWRADPLSLAVEAAWDSGIAVVTAAGNDGAGTVSSPGRDPWVVTVGASDPRGTGPIDDDVVPVWSGRDARTAKPELVAPGVGVVSLRAPGSLVDETHPAARVGDAWFRGSGTSMATALTSGAAAVALWARPAATPDDVKAALVGSADSIAGGVALDLGGALEAGGADAGTAPGAARGRLPGVLDAPEWAGVRWSGVRWSGVRWSGVRWSGVRWSGVRWSAAMWPDGS
jgi:serine protease AprX